MKTHVVIALFIIVLLTISSWSKAEESKSSLVPEGQYQALISEFGKKEPVQTYLAIQDLLSEGKIEAASELTTEPSQFFDKMQKYKERVGAPKLLANREMIRKALILHSVYHEQDQSLLVVDTGKLKAALFFHRVNGKFLQIEVGGSIKVNPKLNRKFYIAKGEPGAILQD